MYADKYDAADFRGQASAAIGPAPTPPLLQRIGSLLRELNDYQVEADGNLHDLSGQLFGYTPEAGQTKGADRNVACMGDELVDAMIAAVNRARSIHERASRLKSALV